MTVSTGGPIRGFIGRWLMRVQAVQGTLQLVGIAVTAASTLTSALVALGYTTIAPYLLGAGPVVGLAYAYVYVEWGIFARKNRETHDRGSNYATPRDVIDDTLIGVAEFTARNGRKPTAEERALIQEAVREQWDEMRDGIEIDD